MVVEYRFLSLFDRNAIVQLSVYRVKLLQAKLFVENYIAFCLLYIKTYLVELFYLAMP